ncbi:MAG TPA: trypsin-like peptidase domain-containing protein, partial [Thermoleophilaceae bacterium]|nr:trypsin-like peptidase domain-containing protein [Thermoleophilaceae bacterium]
MKRLLAVGGAALALAAPACDSSDDEGSGEAASTTREVTTTRVEVVEGIGREGGFDPGEIYSQLSPGVVTVLSIFNGPVSVLDEDGEGGQGSGFVLDDEGYVVTNAHVVTIDEEDGVQEAEQVFVQFSDGNRVAAEIVGRDPNADVALLKLDPEGLKLTPLLLGSSDDLEVGAPVAAIGSPFGEEQSLSVGVVSAVDRNIQSLTRFGIGDAIQTDAAINPGNSGGPLLDARGRVIGVNAQIKSQSGGGEGVGFAIPVDAVRRSLRELRGDGRVDYGYLGVETLIVWPQLAERLGLDAAAGAALVRKVEADSPAEDEGLDAGDETIEFQGQPGIPS